MVTFLTLLLGLVTGEVPVRLVVGPDVAAIELLLDGREVARLTGEPWEAAIDLGPELAPRRLEAIAYDEEGRELSRARQMLNVPRPPAEAGIALEPAPGGDRLRASVLWQNVLGEEPLEVRVSFDGKPLSVADPKSFELPPHDPGELHFVRAELLFAGDVTAVAEAVFGAASDRVAQELTGVPARLPEGARAPAAASLSRTLTAGGQPARVVAVEEPPAELLVVLDPGAKDALRQIGAPLRSGYAVLPPTHRLRSVAWLGSGHTVRILWPYALRRGATALDFDVFPLSEEASGEAGGLYWLLAEQVVNPPVAPETRMADAVAVAGLQAARRDRRRVVLLLTSQPSRDVSAFDPHAVQSYLARLGVPLHVWSLQPKGGPEGAGTDHGFSGAVTVRTVPDLNRAARDLVRDLEAQRILWVEGRWLPGEVELAEGGTLLPVTEPPPPAPPQPPRPAVAEGSGADRVTESLRALGGAAEPPPAASLTDRLRRARFLTRMEPGAIQRLGPWPLITDLPVEEHEALDPLAEGVIAAYGERFGLEPPPARSPEVVVLFRRAEEYRLFSELGSEAAGLELEGHAGGGLAVLHLERAAEEGASLLVHELVHLLNRRTFGGELPPWLEEGLAVELASHRLDEAGRPQPGTLWGERVVRERGLRLGMGGTRLEEEIELTGALAALGRLAKLTEEGRLPPVSALFDLTPDRFVGLSARELRYAQAGALVRFLLDGPRADAFRSFLAETVAGEPVTAERLYAALGTAPGELDRAFETWVRAEARRHGVVPGAG